MTQLFFALTEIKNMQLIEPSTVREGIAAARLVDCHADQTRVVRVTRMKPGHEDVGDSRCRSCTSSSTTGVADCDNLPPRRELHRMLMLWTSSDSLCNE